MRAFTHSSGLTLLELEDPLDDSVRPFSPGPSEPAREGARFYVFGESECDGPSPARVHVISEHPVEVRLDDRGLASAGTPIVDGQARLVGVVRSPQSTPDGGGNVVLRDALDSMVARPPEEVQVRRELTAGGSLSWAGFVEPERIFGFGIEFDLEFAAHDEWSIATSVAAFGLGPDEDSFSGYRFQHELRVGYRALWPTFDGVALVADLSLGAAIGYDRLPELIPGEDGRRWWVRPTARLSLRVLVMSVTYAFYLDPEDPAASAHQFLFGFVIEP